MTDPTSPAWIAQELTTPFRGHSFVPLPRQHHCGDVSDFGSRCDREKGHRDAVHRERSASGRVIAEWTRKEKSE